MLSLSLRIILIVASIISFILCVKKVKQAKLKVSESIIWIIGSFTLIIMSLFSNIVSFISEKLGFMAPVNFVFFVVMVFLLIETFMCNIRMSILNEKLKNLNHEIALKEKKEDIKK